MSAASVPPVVSQFSLAPRPCCSAQSHLMLCVLACASVYVCVCVLEPLQWATWAHSGCKQRPEGSDLTIDFYLWYDRSAGKLEGWGVVGGGGVTMYFSFPHLPPLRSQISSCPPSFSLLSYIEPLSSLHTAWISFEWIRRVTLRSSSRSKALGHAWLLTPQPPPLCLLFLFVFF